MFIEITPIKQIDKLSLYFDGYYLGKDKTRNAFIRSADKLYKSEVILDGKVIEGSWLKQVEIMRRKNAQVIYRLTDKGEELLTTIFTKFGEFSFVFVEEIGACPKLTEKISIDNISKDMILRPESVISVVSTHKY